MNEELGVLKTILTDKRIAIEFTHENSEKLFSSDYWFFAKKLIDYIKVYRDIPTKRVLLEKLNLPKTDQKHIYISSIWDKVDSFNYDQKEYKHDLEVLKTNYANLLLSKAQSEIIVSNKTTKDVKDTLNKLQSSIQELKSLNNIKKFEQKTLKDAIPAFRERYSAKRDNPEFAAGIMTGFSFLDYTLNGLRQAEMLLIGAESGGGKSLMLNSFGVNMWLQQNDTTMREHFGKGYNIVFFSLEMPFDDCFERILARLAMVNQKKLRDSKLNEEELEKVRNVVQFIDAYPYHFEIIDMPRGATIENIEAIFNEIKINYTPDVIIIDYLSLMEYEEKNAQIDDWLKLEKISEKLHEFGRVHNVVVLSAVQLTDIKRGGKHKDPSMLVGQSRIGRSSGIIKNANFGLQILKRENEEQYPDVSIHMIKSRRSELVSSSLIKNYECCAILDGNFSQQELDTGDISGKL